MSAGTSPCCARCGAATPEATPGHGHVVLRLLRLPGEPAIAWCHGCLDHDLLADRDHINRLGWDQVLRLIHQRGPGRVIRQEQAVMA